MMRKRERIELERLLVGSPDPSPRELAEAREAILDQATTKRHAKRPHGSWWVAWVPAGAVAAAAVLAVLVLADVTPQRGSEFAARGGNLTAGAFSPLCLSPNSSEPRSTCRRGDTIVFDLHTPAQARYFSAAALGPDGTLRLLFPSATESSLLATGTTVSHRGIVIDSTYIPGTYRVFGLFSEEALSVARMHTKVAARASGELDSHDSPLLEAALELVGQ